MELLDFLARTDTPFTFAHALRAGVTRVQLERAAREGAIARLARGVYARSDLEARYGGVSAAVFSGRTIAAAATAAALHGLWTPQHPHPSTAHCHRVQSSHGRHALAHGPMLIPSVAWTALLLARHQESSQALIPVDSALRLGVQRTELAELCERMTGWPGTSGLSRAVSLGDGLSESPLESAGRARFAEARLPAPQLQWPLKAQGQRYRVDFCWPDAGVIAEADGLVKYADPAAIRQEKLRHSHLSDLGFVVLRFGWADLQSADSGFIRGLRLALAKGALAPR